MASLKRRYGIHLGEPQAVENKADDKQQAASQREQRLSPAIGELKAQLDQLLEEQQAQRKDIEGLLEKRLEQDLQKRFDEVYRGHLRTQARSKEDIVCLAKNEVLAEISMVREHAENRLEDRLVDLERVLRAVQQDLLKVHEKQHKQQAKIKALSLKRKREVSGGDDNDSDSQGGSSSSDSAS